MFLFVTFIILHTFFNVYIVDFKQVNVSWDTVYLILNIFISFDFIALTFKCPDCDEKPEIHKSVPGKVKFCNLIYFFLPVIFYG